ncbi:flavin reductase family protein [uncultured Roseobacter sp.]|uniref:flavin reductase family protein n=1 Tax=uncultured Roseobacter sp. TaxID=114847 RepID=UPI002608A6B5|nr:flavin reductase family protein [uncultured Roseobacter sp.]
MTGIDPRALRSAFGSFMTGVTVVTAMDDHQKPVGFTANSFTSVSLEPPLLLVCLAKTSGNYDVLTAAANFAVNVLAEDQTEVSNTFARPVEDRFATVKWRRGPNGGPVLEGVCAWFDCSMHQQVDAGDHVILVGEVQAFDSTPAPGLGYVRGAYVTPSTGADLLTSGTDLVVSAIIIRDGHVLLVDSGDGGSGLPEAAVKTDGASAALTALIAGTDVPAEPGFVYSVFEDTGRRRQHISFLCQADAGVPSRGTFVPLSPAALDDISDPAVLSMLERLSQEMELGQFGIYFGNQNRGQVRPVLQGD